MTLVVEVLGALSVTQLEAAAAVEQWGRIFVERAVEDFAVSANLSALERRDGS